MSSATLEAPPPTTCEYQLVLAPAPVLSQPSDPVTQFGTPLFEMVAAMKEIVIANGALGLSAPQVGVSKRVIVYTPHADVHPTDRDIRAIVNPRVLAFDGPMESDWEGCLSNPNVRVRILRHGIVDVAGENLAGIAFTKRFTGLTARIIQHEIDHLDGINITDHAGLIYCQEPQPL